MILQAPFLKPEIEINLYRSRQVPSQFSISIPPVSLQKHELQSFFHVEPGVHSGELLLRLKIPLWYSQAAIVHAGNPSPVTRLALFRVPRNIFHQRTCALAIIASIAPSFAWIAVGIRWIAYGALLNLFRRTSTLCAEPANSIRCTPASITILKV
jgi:hypothetical protein